MTVARHMNGYKVVVTKSTVPVGTGERLRRLIREHQSEFDFGIVSNPEFLREGAAIDDFMRPDRVVIGSRDEPAIAIMRDLYRPLYLIETPVVITSLEAAELTKYASNAFLATKISFINEIANLCDRIGCDVHDVARAMGMDNRIGRNFLHPGPGYGGTCFPKDTTALLRVAQEYESESLIVEAVVEVNRRQRRADGREDRETGRRPEGQDHRRARPLLQARDRRHARSPVGRHHRGAVERGREGPGLRPCGGRAGAEGSPDIEYAEDEYAAVEGADALVFMTEWNQFRALDMERVKELMRAPKIADLRNIYEPERMRELGFDYVGVGR